MATRRRKSTTRRKPTRRRTTAVKRRRRRSSVGFIKGVDFQNVAGLGTGALTGKSLDVLVSKLFPTLDDNLKAGAKVTLGLLLPTLLKVRGWDKFIKGVGDGWIANGFGDFAISAGLPSIVSGIASTYIPRAATKTMQQTIPTVNGTRQNAIPTINGCELEELETNF